MRDQQLVAAGLAAKGPGGQVMRAGIAGGKGQEGIEPETAVVIARDKAHRRGSGRSGIAMDRYPSGQDA